MAQPYTRAHIAARQIAISSTPEEIEDKFTSVFGPYAGARMSCEAAGLKRCVEAHLREGEESLGEVRFVTSTYPFNQYGLDMDAMYGDARAAIPNVYAVKGPAHGDTHTYLYVDKTKLNLRRSINRYNSTAETERAYLEGRNEKARSLIDAEHPASAKLRTVYNIR